MSLATVDRVLHGRPGVSARAVRAVEQALVDLDRQQTQLRLGARTLLIDLVMQAPKRFQTVTQEALEAELPTLLPATIRARFHFRERGAIASLTQIIDRIGTRGRASDGLLLKAPDVPEMAAAIERLAARGIPTVTLVTDIRESPRLAYLGPDNAAAGATAAYLVQQWCNRTRGSVLVTLSRTAFFGERERLDGFRAALATSDPRWEIIVLADADGLDEGMGGLVRDLLATRRDIAAVYSIGGGNRAILAALDAASVQPRVYLGHDLDAENLVLLRSGAIDAVLHHDLRADLRRACQQILRAHRLLRGAPTSHAAPVQIITPHNVPARLR